jgi:ubiquinone/menaquinone biosynthesis C-methylase UbiE
MGWMTKDPVPQAQVDAAKAYEALMVPALFGQWASRVADAAQIAPGMRVLDVACGTGILAREAASLVGPAGFVTGLDPNAGMLEVARQLAPALEWRLGVAESLPFEDQSFDAVLTQFGLMFFDAPQKALSQAHRVLISGGRLAVAVWDSLDNNPAYAAEVVLLERLAGQPAADAVRAPFRFGNRRDLGKLFEEAGVTSLEVVSHQGLARFPSVRVMVEADLRGWLPVMGVVLSEEEIARILEEAEGVLDPYVRTDGTVGFECSAHIVTGSKP